MSIIYVLDIEDRMAGPSLELMRRVCEPDSTSQPHITVYGPVDDSKLQDVEWMKKSNLWQNELFDEITLSNPGLFISKGKKRKQYTVFISCDLHKHIWFHYKPDFNTSLPHITIYDGSSNIFAEKLLNLLGRYKWNIKVSFTKKQKLRTINLGNKKKNKSDRIKYTQSASNLFYKLTNTTLNTNLLKKLTIDARLDYIKNICDNLFEHTTGQKASSTSNPTKLRIEQNHALQVVDEIKKGYGSKVKQLELFKKPVDIKKTKRAYRNLFGQFTTPPELAYEIACYARTLFPARCPPIHFGDPALGTGTFFSAIYKVFPPKSIKSAVGIEIDGTIALATKTLLGRYGLQVLVGDFFQKTTKKDRNLIIANPPYVRHHLISYNQKEKLHKQIKNELSYNINGLSSLYIYFILLCHKWLDIKGYSIWLIPTEFMVTNYGSLLRNYLLEKVTLLRVHRYDTKDVQFDGVLVTSSVVAFRNQTPKPENKVLFSFGGTLEKPLDQIHIPLTDLKARKRWPSTKAQCIEIKKPTLLLKDIFLIKRGIATGYSSFFILKREDAISYGIPSLCVKPILPSPKKLTNSIIQSDKDGYPKIDPQLVVIDCPFTEDSIKNKYPKMWHYLETAVTKGVTDRYLVKSRKLWYKQEHRDIPYFLCTYLGRTSADKRPFRFILNNSQAIASNLYLLLYPKAQLAEAIDKNPSLKYDVFNALNKISSNDIISNSRVYGGGLYKLEPRELGNVTAESFYKIVPGLIK